MCHECVARKTLWVALTTEYLACLTLASVINCQIYFIISCLASTTEGGSAGLELLRSKWWAASSITIATTVSEMDFKIPPPYHGSSKPFLWNKENTKISFITSVQN